jgi:acid stress chaperone HdeB
MAGPMSPDQNGSSTMKRRILAISAIVFLAANSMASAQVTVDVSKITCDEFVKYDIADPRQITAWISGYYHGLHNNPVDKQKTLEGSENIEGYCFKHPDALVMETLNESGRARDAADSDRRDSKP